MDRLGHMMHAIVTGDDLGLNESVNRAIITSLLERYCTSASLMANMPGFDDAVALIGSHGLQDRIGVHLVLTEGQALSQAIRECPRLCDSKGAFLLTRSRRVWRLTRSERRAVSEEFRQQIARCRSSGIRLTHADSHSHIHEEWGILPLVIEVCRRQAIPFLRLARNCGPTTGRCKTMYRTLVNHRIASAGLAHTLYFGSWADYEYSLPHMSSHAENCSIEIMVHPVLTLLGRLVDSTTSLDLAHIRATFAQVPTPANPAGPRPA